MKQYDYILVGAGLFSGVINYLARQQGKKCLVVERRDHMGGNVYCEDVEGIHVHKYGAHIFHTSNKKVWKFVNDLVEFNRYTNSPIANYKGEIYNMPFNMNTFSKMWGVRTPQEAKAKIDQQRSVIQGEPRNLEEQAISLVGTDIYQKLVKGYTEKQWGRDCKDLPSFIIKRLPVRFTYDNNYFNDAYQGIPMGGYNVLVDKLFEGADVELGVDFLANREKYEALGDTIIYTGAIDAYYDYCFGKLEYRTVRFETEVLDTDNYQGVAVVNYTDRETPYTRVIEHKHFEFGTQPKTVISKEYSTDWHQPAEPLCGLCGAGREAGNLPCKKYRTVQRASDSGSGAVCSEVGQSGPEDGSGSDFREKGGSVGEYGFPGAQQSRGRVAEERRSRDKRNSGPPGI